MLVGTRSQAALAEKRPCDYFERANPGIKVVKPNDLQKNCAVFRCGFSSNRIVASSWSSAVRRRVRNVCFSGELAMVAVTPTNLQKLEFNVTTAET